MRRLLSVVGTVLLSVAAAGCSNKLGGSAKANTKAAGEFTLSPSACYSGQRESFFGVQLEDDKSGAKLRVIKPPADDYQVVVEAPSSKGSFKLVKRDCTKFDVSVTKQNSQINDIFNVEGHATIDCKSGDDTFTADVTFANCH
jgi:hypothetical protein